MPAQLTPAGKLTPVREEGGVRFHLNGEPVHAGDVLDLLMADDTWMRGRFEANGRSAEASFHWTVPAAGQPADGEPAEASMWLPGWATLRWPAR